MKPFHLLHDFKGPWYGQVRWLKAQRLPTAVGIRSLCGQSLPDLMMWRACALRLRMFVNRWESLPGRLRAWPSGTVRRRSPSKVKERTHEKLAEALLTGRTCAASLTVSAAIS